MRFLDLGLGPLAVEVEGVERVFAGTRQAALLAMLVLNVNSWVSRDRLAAAGWGIDATVSAASVENQVSRLRKLVASSGGDADVPAVVGGAGGYRLSAPENAVDSRRFERLADQCARLLTDDNPAEAYAAAEEALRLWRGTPYEALGDDTAIAVVARLEELRAQVLERRIDALLGLGDLDRVLTDSEALVSQMPFRERLWAQRMTGLARSGRIEEALRTYQSARKLLIDETGLEPGPLLRDLQAKILNGDPALAGAESIAPRHARSGPVQLPRQLPDLIGRSDDLARLAALIVDRPLVTVTGSGGCGKTRLAIEAARAAAGSFPDGVWFVDLTAVSDPDRLVEVVVSTLGLTHAALGTSLATLADYVQTRRVLLVLDNCEHVLTAAAVVAEALTRRDGDQAVLATSREPLGLPEECLLPLDPLPLTSVQRPGVARTAGSSPAAELFVRRARAAAPTMDPPGPEQLQIIDEICADLDGLPLAIELAAARARSFTLTEIAAQVAADPTRLARIGHGSSDHRRTLHEAIDWSYRLLPPAEQALHRRLSVLQGTFTLRAAQAVADSGDVENLLAQLVHRSLLTATPPASSSRPTAFAQLATVRSHAQHRLAEAAETAATVSRRDRWVRELLAERPPLGRAEEAAWLDRLDDDYSTVRAALQDSLLVGGDVELLLLGTRLEYFWYYRSRVPEGLRWLEDALAVRSGATELSEIRLALVSALFLSVRVDDARRTAEAALAGVGDVSDERLVSVGERLVCVAHGAWTRNAFDIVHRVLQLLDPITERSLDSNLALLTRSVHSISELPNPDTETTIANASTLYDDAVAGGNLTAAWAACAVIDLTAQHTGQAELGEQWTDRLIEAHLSFGSGGGGVFLEALANFAAMTDGDPTKAVRLYAAAITQTRRVGMSWPFQDLTDGLFDQLRRRVDEETFQRAWQEGESLTLEDVARLRGLSWRQ